MRPDKVVANGLNADSLRLDLDNEWDGLDAVLVVGPCGNAEKVAYEGDPVPVPPGLLSEPGWLPVSVVGYGEDGEVRVVTADAPRALQVVPSGCYDGADPYPGHPDLLSQLIGAGDAAESAAERAEAAAALIPDGGEPGQVLTRTEEGAAWEDYAGAGGGSYAVGHGLKVEGGALVVDAAQAVERDNTLPVTSAAVYTEVGNIGALLEGI